MSEKKVTSKPSALQQFGSHISDVFLKLRRGYALHATIIAVFIFAVALMFPRGKSFEYSDLKVGEIYVGEPIIANFTFSIIKPNEEYERDKDAARAGVPPYFFRQDSISDKSERELAKLLDSISEQLGTIAPDSVKAAALGELFLAQQVPVSDSILSFFLFQTGSDSAADAAGQEIVALSSFKNTLLQIAKDINSIGILNIAPADLQQKTPQLALRVGNEEIKDDLGNYSNITQMGDEILKKLRSNFDNEGAVRAGYEVLTKLIKPNIFYDEVETSARTRQAIARVPRANGTVLEKERIIGSNEKVTAGVLQKLESYALAKAEREGMTTGLASARSALGKIILVCLGSSFIILFLVMFRPAIFKDARKLLMILISLFLVIFLGHLAGQFGLSEYFIPVAITAMVLTIFYSPTLAFMGTVSLALLLAGLRGNAFSVAVITLVVGSIAILSVRKVRSRSWLFKSILWIIGAYIIAIGSLELVRYSSIDDISQNMLFGITNGFLSPILTYGLLVIFEYLFDMTTDATLLELSDLNKPLLRELAMRAPGSYHHSIMVGSLSEAAAEAIGANSLLTRVGAYYHDIGKMEKPEYFVENQKGGKNPHEKLSPSMSFLILASHVKRGIEIAQAHGLPKEIQVFIAEHHGTNLMLYFYQKAIEKADGKEINEIDFRYPGPKPQSKETGIVMLADAVEATSRTLKDPSVTRLRNLVNNIIDDRFKNSELDECPLTLRDLTLIQDAFVQILTGIFHGRIEYPGQDQLLGEETEEHQPAEAKESENGAVEEKSNGQDMQQQPLPADQPPGAEEAGGKSLETT